MTKLNFKYGKYAGQIGLGKVEGRGGLLEIYNDDFLLVGDIVTFRIYATNASLDAKDATVYKDLYLNLNKSKAENINAYKIWLKGDGSVSNTSTNELEITRGNNTIDGIVSANVVKFSENSTLTIAKDAVLKVPDINALKLDNIRGEGKIYDEKTQAYYDTNNKLLEHSIDLSTLKAGDGNEAFSFDGSKLVLNKGYEFNLNGDKSVFIVNNGTILKAEINGDKLRDISSSGSIKELHLSNKARFRLDGDFEKAVIDKNSVLVLYKPVDFKNISGGGLVKINDTIYNTSGRALNNANNSVEANIKEHNFAMAKTIEKVKEQKNAYVNNIDKQSENNNVELLSVEMANNDNLL